LEEDKNCRHKAGKFFGVSNGETTRSRVEEIFIELQQILTYSQLYNDNREIIDIPQQGVNSLPNLQHHEMQLEKTHPSGAAEWLCPTCGRRFLMQLAPTYKKIVLEPGDPHAQHSGGTGGLLMGHLQVSDNGEYEFSDELRAALEEALEDVDFENLSSSDDSQA
jgi:hypothetical protein